MSRGVQLEMSNGAPPLYIIIYSFLKGTVSFHTNNYQKIIQNHQQIYKHKIYVHNTHSSYGSACIAHIINVIFDKNIW